MDETNWPKGIRRDCEPHRGDFLRLLGKVASGAAFLSVNVMVCFFFLILGLGGSGTVLVGLAFPFAVLSMFCLILGIILRNLTRRDLAAMQVEQLDPTGIAATTAARDAARSAIVKATAAILLFWALTVLLLVWQRI
jgi:hypothetical protein